MNNIYLCGFMGTGKTAVGVSLSKKLNVDYYDTDKLIIRQQQMTIPEIFEKFGNARFREMEVEISKYTGQFENAVISTGGGLTIPEQNVIELKKHGKIIYLNTPFEECYKRITGDRNRPVTIGKTKQDLLDLYNERHAIYSKACDIEIHCEGIVSKIADDIVALL